MFCKDYTFVFTALSFKCLMDDVQQTIVNFGLEFRREVGARDPFVIDQYGRTTTVTFLET